MKSVDEVRRENLIAESKRLGGDAALGRAIGVKDRNQVYQWLRATDPKQRRNVSTKSARHIEKKLGLASGWLDVEHAGEVAGVKEPAASYQGLAESRPKNNVQALRYALQGFATVLNRMQPDIAEDVAREIVGVAGIAFSSQGFVNTLVGLLAGVERTSEEGLRELLQQPASSKSKPGSARVR
jgi:hypothetical protein